MEREREIIAKYCRENHAAPENRINPVLIKKYSDGKMAVSDLVALVFYENNVSAYVGFVGPHMSMSAQEECKATYMSAARRDIPSWIFVKGAAPEKESGRTLLPYFRPEECIPYGTVAELPEKFDAYCARFFRIPERAA